MHSNKHVKILSLHWGFIPGGVAKYAHCLDSMTNYEKILINTICINAATWPHDSSTISSMMNVSYINISGRSDLAWIKKLRKKIINIKPDLIMCYGFNGCFAAMFSNIGLNVPVVSSWHGDYHPTTLSQRIRSPIFNFLTKILYRYIVKDIVAVSAYSRKLLIKKGVDPKKITVIHNGISPLNDNFKPDIKSIRDKLSVSDDELLIGTACRLDTPKGLHWLLYAIADIVKKKENLKFVIWGDGPLMADLQSLAKELSINKHLFFPGYRSDIDNCLSALDIFVISSFVENFSIALLEAMRAGLPIVATNVGGNPEAIENGVQGLLVPVAEPLSMANAIIKLADNDNLRKCLGKQARLRFFNEFTSDKMVNNTAEWIMNCANKHASL